MSELEHQPEEDPRNIPTEQEKNQAKIYKAQMKNAGQASRANMDNTVCEYHPSGDITRVTYFINELGEGGVKKETHSPDDWTRIDNRGNDS